MRNASTAATAAKQQPGQRGRQHQARAAIRHLTRSSPELARLIARVGPYRPALTPDPFRALVGSIVHQQVSMSAGAAIYGRLRDSCPRRRLTPKGVLALTEESLRAAGVSRQKAACARNIAAVFASRELTAAKLRRMPDEEVIRAVTRLKGVGRWTAEMLLIFGLERPDVWPLDDFGLKKAVQKLLGLASVPSVAVMNELAEPWRPYRTYATWYLWRSLEGPLMPAVAR